MPEEKNEKIAIYLRVSGESQIVGDGFERQRDKCQQFATSKGFSVLGEWREEGVSGKVECEQRPAFQSMLAELLSNGCRTIIVEDLSRLARRYAIQEQILLYLCSKGVTLWSCANGGENITEAMSADPTRRLVIGMMGLISQWEREQIVAKLAAARKRKKLATGRCDGRLPYGMKPGEQTVLTMILAGKAHGMTNSQITDVLNSQEILTRYGKSWKPNTVGKIIAREQKKMPLPPGNISAPPERSLETLAQNLEFSDGNSVLPA